MDREKQIVKTSLIGIGANVLLAAFKAVIGLMSNSIAIVLDSVNNLSDALSSTITIIGTKIAGKKPDKKHPMGHGRAEYITSAIISIVISYAGITSFIESVKKIITPEKAEYSTVTLIIVAAAIFVKLILGTYVQKVGKNVDSESLIASGKDAMFDAVIAFSTLIAAIVNIVWNVSIEAYVGIFISIMIIKAGIEMISGSMSLIVGERADAELSRSIKEAAREIDGVYGVYDLVINNYGPGKYIVSLHVEVDDKMTAGQIDAMTRRIQHNVLKKCGAIVAAVGIYSINSDDEEANAIRNEVSKIIHSHEHILQVHGFYYDRETKTISADYIMDFAAPDPKGEYVKICDEIKAKYPDCELKLNIDLDVSD